MVIFNNGLFMKFDENGNSFFNIKNHSKINMRLSNRHGFTKITKFNFDSKFSFTGIFQALLLDLVLIGTSSLKLALVLLSSTLLKLQTRSGFLLQTVIVSTEA